ncbi:MAG: AbrB/MazE/SpoVT family DNA-binding domain-containing protein [Chloroflexi bacterium]|nr:MAG: AbrB/MazE/SpoVT family DNA-binding domain-containing protein [Chloroflexota bacterium]
MEARVKMWGESLVLQIPRLLAEEAGLKEGSRVELILEGGRLVIMPVVVPEYRLEELLAGVTQENIHEEVDMGPAMGEEVW